MAIISGAGSLGPPLKSQLCFVLILFTPFKIKYSNSTLGRITLAALTARFTGHGMWVAVAVIFIILALATLGYSHYTLRRLRYVLRCANMAKSDGDMEFGYDTGFSYGSYERGLASRVGVSGNGPDGDSTHAAQLDEGEIASTFELETDFDGEFAGFGDGEGGSLLRPEYDDFVLSVSASLRSRAHLYHQRRRLSAWRDGDDAENTGSLGNPEGLSLAVR
jgi:hypothetical protein